MMQAWEYITLGQLSMTLSKFSEEINTYGKKGWELVAVTTETSETTATAYFKRPNGKVDMYEGTELDKLL